MLRCELAQRRRLHHRSQGQAWYPHAARQMARRRSKRPANPWRRGAAAAAERAGGLRPPGLEWGWRAEPRHLRPGRPWWGAPAEGAASTPECSQSSLWVSVRRPAVRRRGPRRTNGGRHPERSAGRCSMWPGCDPGRTLVARRLLGTMWPLAPRRSMRCERRPMRWPRPGRWRPKWRHPGMRRARHPMMRRPPTARSRRWMPRRCCCWAWRSQRKPQRRARRPWLVPAGRARRRPLAAGWPTEGWWPSCTWWQWRPPWLRLVRR